MQKIIGNKYSDFYLNAAKKLNLNYKIINKKAILAKIYNDKKEIYLVNNVLNVNCQVSGHLSGSKIKTSTILQSRKIPSPKFKDFEKKEKALNYALKQIKLKKDIVIKPSERSLAYGVTVKPKTKNQINRAIKEAFDYDKKIMIEEFIQGENYRITIFQKQIIGATWRKSAYIIGDGKNNIKNLISQKNKKRAKQKLPLIILRQKDKDYLKNNNITLNLVPKKNEEIKLQLGCDLDIGGERQFISINSIPKENQKMFKKAVNSLMLNFAGIDFITQDITKSYKKVICGINEINSRPMLDVHYLDQNPPKNYAAEKILETYFFEEPVIKDKILNFTNKFIPAD